MDVVDRWVIARDWLMPEMSWRELLAGWTSHVKTREADTQEPLIPPLRQLDHLAANHIFLPCQSYSRLSRERSHHMIET